MFTVAMVVISAMLVVSCGDGSGGSGNGNSRAPDEINYTLSGLSSDTLYYWKIIAKDDKGGESSSIVWNFTTQ